MDREAAASQLRVTFPQSHIPLLQSIFHSLHLFCADLYGLAVILRKRDSPQIFYLIVKSTFASARDLPNSAIGNGVDGSNAQAPRSFSLVFLQRNSPAYKDTLSLDLFR